MLKKILFTGESGLLGREFRNQCPQIIYPLWKDFDIVNFEQMDNYLKNKSVKTFIHAAAFTSPPKVDKEPEQGIINNIIGTANVVLLCKKYDMKLIYLCTDYVFKGDRGEYKEDDPVFPVNKYAWSKLGGECAVRMYDNSLIIRTSFGPNQFPYEGAFIDQWTSRLSVSELTKKILFVLDKDIKGTIHIGGKRKTVYQYAKELEPKKEIKELSIDDVNFKVPKDTSLNGQRFEQLFY